MSLSLPSYILSYFHNMFIYSYLHIYISTYITIMHIYKSQSLDIHCIGTFSRGLMPLSWAHVAAPSHGAAESWRQVMADESIWWIDDRKAPRPPIWLVCNSTTVFSLHRDFASFMIIWRLCHPFNTTWQWVPVHHHSKQSLLVRLVVASNKDWYRLRISGTFS